MILAPIWASTTPKVEEDGKTLTRMTFKLVNHETHILAKQNLNIQPERWMTLKSLALPPRQA
jgi:hypothetical protein